MKVTNVSRALVGYGLNEWRVCTRVILWGWIVMWASKLLERIIKEDLKLISMEWDFTSNTEVIEVIRGLSGAGYEIIYNTDSWDDIWAMVSCKNVSLSIKIEIPVDWEEVNFVPQILSYFKTKDEIRFSVKDKTDYDNFRHFQKTKNISNPTKILEVALDYKNAFENNLFKDVLPMDKIIVKYV